MESPLKSPYRTRGKPMTPRNKALDLTGSNRAILAAEDDGMTWLSVQESSGDVTRCSTPVQFHNEERSFVTSQMVLHDGGRRALFTTADQDHTIVRADVERGETIDQFSVYRNGEEVKLPLRRIAITNKFGGLDSSPLVDLVGVGNDKGNCLLHAVYDPRCPSRTVAVYDEHSDKAAKERTGRSYAKREFACIATSRDGHVIVGDVAGKVSLYDDVRKIAKATFDQLADPVTGVDITADGEWVMWSTAVYHVLLGPLTSEFWTRGRTKIKDTPYVVIKLSEVVRDEIGVGTDEPMTPAIFDCENGLLRDTPGVVESRVISAVGRAVVVWPLRVLQRFSKNGGGTWKGRPLVHKQEGVVKALHGEFNSAMAVAALEMDVRRLSLGGTGESDEGEEEGEGEKEKEKEKGGEGGRSRGEGGRTDGSKKKTKTAGEEDSDGDEDDDPEYKPKKVAGRSRR
ncbi:hypothetical protein CBR_g24115 [Chara braunii]|uniref:Vacuolar import/degradation Vid27 C-terminal domain-containing protein n=1 Tax=Chara braunii TaxID=69332 RepID=A0A388L5T6_CHABU|nr:hypothetical protein CBR_g24115 [Chara braunii]|eukprot:GBG77669.1 hypothetical protein CBR_g24115 [Chara braunii]